MTERVVIITGASSGIGKACAYFFSQKGAHVVLAARNGDRIDQIAADLHKRDRKALAVQTDVSRAEDCKNLVDQTIAYFGRIDVLINNAGISMRGLFSDTSLDVLRQLMDINFWGTVYCTHYALPYILKQKGSVVGVSSIAGFQGLPGRTGYSSSKFAMHGFLQTLRVENLKTGLHVMIAAPGFTSTNVRKSALGPDGRSQGESPRDEHKMMEPEKVAEILFRGIHRRKRQIIMTRQGKITVWMRRLLPKLTDKITYRVMAREPDSPFK